MDEERAALPDFRIRDMVVASSYIIGFRPLVLLTFGFLPSIPDIVLSLADHRPNDASALGFADTLLSGALCVFAFSVLCLTAWQIHQRGQTDIANAIFIGLKRFPASAGTAVLSTLLIMAGFSALFVPGLMAIALLYVVVPTNLLERKGPVESMERSGELTIGKRARILGLALLATLPSCAIYAVTSPTASPLQSTLIDAAATALFLLCNATFATMCFAKLSTLPR